MDIKADEISKIIRDQLGDYSLDVAWRKSARSCRSATASPGSTVSKAPCRRRCLEFPHGVFGIALNLEESSVGAGAAWRNVGNQGRRHRQAHGYGHLRAGW